MKKNFIAVMSVAALLFSCQSGEKAPMFYKLPALPFSIEGTHANLVKGSSTEWFFFRDSVSNEETDTIYKVTVDAKIKLEKDFAAERMDTFPQLKFISEDGKELVVMNVEDSIYVNDIIHFFLNTKPGAEKEIRFVGTMSKANYLLMPKAKHVILSHFSIYDPEANADPEITKMIDGYFEIYQQIKELLDEGMPPASTAMMRHYGTLEEYEAKLKAKEKLMTPAQVKRYKGISKDIQKL